MAGYLRIPIRLHDKNCPEIINVIFKVINYIGSTTL